MLVGYTYDMYQMHLATAVQYCVLVSYRHSCYIPQKDVMAYPNIVKPLHAIPDKAKSQAVLPRFELDWVDNPIGWTPLLIVLHYSIPLS